MNWGRCGKSGFFRNEQKRKEKGGGVVFPLKRLRPRQRKGFSNGQTKKELDHLNNKKKNVGRGKEKGRSKTDPRVRAARGGEKHPPAGLRGVRKGKKKGGNAKSI